MKKVAVYCIVLSLMLISGGRAQALDEDARFGAEVKYWFSELDGEVQIASVSIKGTTIDFVDDLNMDEDEGIPEVELWYKFGEKNKLSLSYFKVEHDGDKTLEKTVTFKGTDYTISTLVESELETSLLKLMYERGLLYREGGGLSFLAGIDYLGFEAKLSTSTISKSEEINIPIPVIGLAGWLALPVEGLSVKGEISGITVDVDDNEATLVDLSVGLAYAFNENWGGELAYRYFDIDGESDDDEANFTLSGPVLSIIGRF